MLPIETNEDIERKRKEKLESDKPETPFSLLSLASHLRGEWMNARLAKSKIEEVLIDSQQRRRCEYSEAKLAAMRALFGQEYSPPYMPITLAKCVAAESWIRDLLFQSNQPPYELDPTPEPELSEEDKRAIVYDLLEDEIGEHFKQAMATGMPVDETEIFRIAKKKVPAKLRAEIKKRAEDLADSLRSKIDDQLVEGGWYNAIDAVIPDITTFKAGFIKGPAFRNRNKLVRKASGKGVEVKNEVIPVYTRVSPFDIFPERDSSGINDGYIFERISYSKVELYSLKGLDGVNETELDAVLTEFSSGGLKEWSNFDSTRAALEDKEDPGQPSSRVDCLEFWGTVDGKFLIEWGMKGEEIDPLKPYNICAWLIGTHVVRALLNPDPLGRKPYHKASWMEIPGSFWGLGIPEVVADPQDACNAVARAMVLNAAFSAGPVTEVNIDRLAAGERATVHPYKTFEVTSKQMMESPVVRFNNATLTADRLIVVYRHFSQAADEVSLPAYAHGDQNVGGAARTASGLSMLFQGASKNMKNVIRSMDKGIIEPSIELLYNYDMVYSLVEDLPDTKILARGSTALILRDQRASQLVEFMNVTMNPMDAQHINRRKLVEAVVRARGFDVTEVMKDAVEEELQTAMPSGKPAIDSGMMRANPQGFNAMTGGSMPKTIETDESGALPAGMEVREFGNGENT